MRKTIFISCCLLFYSGFIYGQANDYHVQKLPAKNGLVQPNQVREMLRDSRGFLWLLTSAKAQRFDGKNVLSFSFDDRCIGIQEDAEGRIWLASRQNIYWFKNEYEGFQKVAAYSSDTNKYLGLLAGPQNKIYLQTADSILQWSSLSKKLEPVINTVSNGGNIQAPLQSCGNFIFFRNSRHTIMRFNTVSKSLDSIHVGEPNYLVPLDEDNVWLRQNIGSSVLASFKTKTITPLNKTQFDEIFTDNNFFITAAFRGEGNEFFTIIQDKGYFRYDAATRKFKRINFFYEGKPLLGKPLLSRNNFFKEKNGTAWFTNEEGIFYMNPYLANVKLLRSATNGNADQWNNDVRSFAEDNKGNIWFGTADGFCRWNKITGSITTWHPDYNAKNSLNYSSVRSIGFSNNKIIIGQSEKGFWIFDPATQNFTRPKFDTDSLKTKFESGFNSNMLQLRNGNFVIMSSNMWLLNNKTFKVTLLNVPEAAQLARRAFEDDQGRIWLLGARGIAALDKDFNVLYSLNDKLLGRWYNAITQKNEYSFWVAAKGLYEMTLLPQKRLSVKQVLPDLNHQHFSDLFKDSLGHVWISSDDGMYRYLPAQNITEKFDRSDNIQNFYAGVSNSFRSSDGTVYFGSLNGINYFIPEKIPLQNDSLQVLLLNVTVNKDDSSFLLTGALKKLNHYQNNLIFDFVSPYLYNYEKIQYRYKLSGADDNWVNNGNNTSVRFNSLKTGNYSFSVAASINGKDWFQIKQASSFAILPPLWKTWWFISILLITCTALIVLYFKKREAFIRKKEAEKTALQKLRASSYREQLEIEQIINHFASSMNNINNIDDLLWDVAKNCISRLGFEDCVIYLVNDERNVLIQKAAWGPKTTEENKILNPIEIKLGQGIVGSIAENGIADIVADTSKDDRYIVDDAKRNSEIAVPILLEEKVIGVIDSENSQKNFYTERHLQVLNTIASLCAGKIETIKAEQQTREKEMEVLRLSKDVATSQLTALRMQMNPHFIFNALNSVQHYILQGNVIEANKYLSKFSRLQREILHCSSQQFISLEKEIEILNSYLELEQFRFGESFAYQVNMTEEIEPVEIKIPPMILQPFVENAIWHGLMPLQTDRNLSIYFDLYSDDILMATIRDNGIGRTASAKLKAGNGAARAEHTSKGMSMIMERLRLLQQQYDKPFDAAISDITDVNGMVRGTQVALKIFIGNTKS